MPLETVQQVFVNLFARSGLNCPMGILLVTIVPRCFGVVSTRDINVNHASENDDGDGAHTETPRPHI